MLQQAEAIMRDRPAPGSPGSSVWLWNDYSLAERDRRWDAIRARAAEAGLDCVFVPIGNGYDARYVTQLPNSAIVLPTDGSAPIVVSDHGSSNGWVPAPRLTGRVWGEPMAQALLDAGMERARIGVVGLKGGVTSHVRAGDGRVIHLSFAHVLDRLPNATFEDATELVGMVRYVKSDEEIECLRLSTQIAEAGVEAMIEHAWPGVDGAAFFAAVVERLLAMGSEYHPLAIYINPAGGPEGSRLTDPPIGTRLGAGDLITNEVSAVWGAQLSQEDQPIVLGPIPEEFGPVIELQREIFEAGLERMTPGTSFGEFIDFVNGFGAKRGGGMKTEILMHGRGYGDDGPLLTPRAHGEDFRDLRIEKGNAWVWKPTAVSPDGRTRFTWGGDVVVTDRGGERLFKRPHGMVSVT